MSILDWSERTGRRIGWIISIAGVVLSATSVTIALHSLQININKNSTDLRSATQAQIQSEIAQKNATLAQHQSAIIQALSILRGPSGPGTNAALELIAHDRVQVPDLRVEGAYLEHSNLSGLEAASGVFDHTDLGGARFTNADIGNASFVGANMSGALLRRLGQPPAIIRNIIVDLKPVSPEEGDPTHSIVTNDAYRMNFSNTNLIGAALDESILRSALFRQADLTNSTFGKADLTMADFTGAITTDTDFSDADFGNGATAARITQHQLDSACLYAGRPPTVPKGLHPPRKLCRP